jgi:hypothetical protein
MLYKESGFVTWKKAGDTEYARVDQDELTLPNNVYIKTVEGRGYVVLPDNSSIALATNTEILINYEPQHVSIEQLLGTTYHRVEALLTGATYEVKTAGTLAAVRGTKFSVTYDKKKQKTRVSVTEHTVSVNSFDPNLPSATSTPTLVKEGTVATVEDAKQSSGSQSSGQPPAPSQVIVQNVSAVPEEKKWIEENKKIDVLLDVQKDSNNKRKIIKDLMQELKKQVPPQDTPKPTAVPQDRMKLIENAIKKIEMDQNAPIQKPVVETKPVTTSPDTTQPTTSTTKPTTQTSTVTQPSGAVTQPASTLKTFVMTGETLSSSDQNFIDTFYATYEKYLYVDAQGTICKTLANETGATVIARLEKVAHDAGYVLPGKPALLSFANDVVTACKDGSVTRQAPTLQSTFDSVYPFN